MQEKRTEMVGTGMGALMKIKTNLLRYLFLVVAGLGLSCPFYGQTPVYPTVPIATLDLTTQAANVGSQTLFTPTATGTYQITVYAVVTQAATSSSTLAQGLVQWTDPDTSIATPLAAVSATYAGNILGGTSVATGANSRIIRAKAGTAVLFSTTGYVSSGVTPMQYALHVTVTRIN